MPLGSYRVLSRNKYIRQLSDSPASKVAAKDIKSMQTDEPLTTGSYGHASPIMLITKDGLVTRTANNRFRFSADDVSEYGVDFNNNGYGHGHWKFAGEDNYPALHNIIPKMPEFAYFTGITPLGLYLPHKGDTQVNLRITPTIVNAVDPNRIGYYEVRKREDVLRSLMFDNANRLNYEASEWVNFLAKKGISVDTTKYPGVIGLGVKQGNFAAGYYANGYLFTEMGFHNTAKRIISRYGLEEPEAIEAMKRSILLHEFAHVLGIEGDRKSEALQGMLQAEFYAMMAEKFKGTKMERVYRALAAEGADYAEWFSRTRWKELFDIEEKENPLELLIAKFEAEGVALGLSGEMLGKYVRARAKETYGALLDGEPSHKKSGKKSKSSKKTKDLDEIVEEESSSKGGNSSRKYSKVVNLSEYRSMRDAKKYSREEAKEDSDAEEQEPEADSEMAEAA